MSKSQKIIICLIIAFFCFLPSKSVVDSNVNLSAEEIEAYAFAGLFAYVDVQEEQPKVPDVVSKECRCKGTGKISYDGGGSLTDCPCKDGTCDCGCVNSKKKGSGDAAGASEEVQIKEKRVRTILVTDPVNCRPCKQVEAGLLSVLRSDAYKKSGWVVDNTEDATLQVLDINNPDDVKEIERLGLSFVAVPTFIRYNTDDDNLSGNVSYEEFLKFSIGGNKHPFYKGKTKTRWNIDGDYSPGKTEIIKHIRSDKDHKEVGSWPLEVLSREDLLSLHSDLHNKDYGKIEWRDK
jgi:hypothetical protein